MDDSSPEIIQAIEDRVTIYKPNIILLREIPIVTPFSIDKVFNRMSRLASSYENCAYLLDITETNLPDANTRRHINGRFKLLLTNVRHVAFVTGKNFLLNTAAKFVMYQTSLESYSINKTYDEAVKKINKALND